MTLTHQPAYTTNHPDRVEDDETGIGYSVLHDDTAEDPRKNFTADAVGLWAYHEPHLSRSVAAKKPAGSIALDAFARFYDTHDAADSLELTRRYLAAFHPEERYSVVISTITGYSQGDWLDMVAAVREGHGEPATHLENFRRWAFGDVWIVIPDGKRGVSNIYADDPEDAVAYYRENFEDEPLEKARPALRPVSEGTSFQITWSIDQEAQSPAAAAAAVWQSIFGRGSTQPGPDEACVFTTTLPDGTPVEIDLSDPEYAELFE